MKLEQQITAKMTASGENKKACSWARRRKRYNGDKISASRYLTTIMTGWCCLQMMATNSQPMANAMEVPVNRRHSFSLSTWDTNGKLEQVERAIRAAHEWSPPFLFAFYHPHNDDDEKEELDDDEKSIENDIVRSSKKKESAATKLFMACPQLLPHGCIQDDGTARWIALSSDICLSHVGLAPDGRVVLAAAQQWAIEHEWTYQQQDLPLQDLLEQLSLLFQEQTRSPGHRPLACLVLVASLKRRCIYQIDPSGAITKLGSHGEVGATTLSTRKQQQEKENDNDSDDPLSLQLQGVSSRDDIVERMQDLISQQLEKQRVLQPPRDDKNKKSVNTNPIRILSASFDATSGLRVERTDLKDKP